MKALYSTVCMSCLQVSAAPLARQSELDACPTCGHKRVEFIDSTFVPVILHLRMQGVQTLMCCEGWHRVVSHSKNDTRLYMTWGRNSVGLKLYEYLLSKHRPNKYPYMVYMNSDTEICTAVNGRPKVYAESIDTYEILNPNSIFGTITRRLSDRSLVKTRCWYRLYLPVFAKQGVSLTTQLRKFKRLRSSMYKMLLAWKPN